MLTDVAAATVKGTGTAEAAPVENPSKSPSLVLLLSETSAVSCTTLEDDIPLLMATDPALLR